MAGHSKFKNIMHRKGAQDKKRAKLFSRLIREISVAAKLGVPNPESNPRLRSAINTALSANMNKDSIEKAIKKNSDSSNNDQIEEIVYEGFGPNGIAIIIDSFTDNKNRTASEIRTAFNKHNGNLGASGSVRHLFEKIGLIKYSKDISSFEHLFDYSAELEIKDIEESEEFYEIQTSVESFHTILEKYEKKYGIPNESGLDWKAKELIEIGIDEARKLILLFEKLEDIDDVQKLSSNVNISDEVMEKIV